MNDRREPTDADDLLLQQVRQVLEPMPPVDRRAIAQILAAVAEREQAPRPWLVRWWESALCWWQLDVPPMARASSLVAAALVVGFLVRGALWAPAATAPVATAPMATAPMATAPMATAPAAPRPTMAPVQAAAEQVGLVPVQFVLDARAVPAATTVSVVGDFNDWDVQAAPLVLDGNAWSGTVPLLPGRHVYAFVVNGTRFMADPRAAAAPDADFGRPGSVILVQTP